MAPRKILITGGGGYIGARVARRCLEQSPHHVALWLHASSEGEFEQKRGVLAEALQPYAQRVSYYGGDLAAPAPFADVDPSDVHIILHTAAVTRFNVEQELAQRINVEGSEKLFQFSERCPKLERVAYLSTLYASGLRSGAIEENAFSGNDGFANHYEQSKWAAETLLQSRYGNLPWQILRIATVVAENEDGGVGQFNAVHNTLKLLYYGLLPLIPGNPDTPLYFVTGDFVADTAFRLLFTSPVRSIYHISHTRAESLTLSELIDQTFAAFNRDSVFRKRRVMPPLYTDQRSFEGLAENVQGFGGNVMKQAVASVSPFAEQLFLHKDVKNSHLLTKIEDYRAPDPRQLLERLCAHLVQTRWGREGALPAL